jgi:acetylornithine deacetylase/succinyl-diaminopimelate desuccinylase-like protein
MGFVIEVVEKEHTPPLIIAKRIDAPGNSTIGIYGHYDIQSEQPIDEWDTDPYELKRANGKLYARGVADNKGHIIQNLTAVRSLIEEGKHVNIICVLEGEEELGSEHFEELVQKKKDLLSQVDVFYVTDNEMQAKGVPTILYALRGLVYFQLDVVAGTYDLHSGNFGNMASNPAQVITNIMAQMKDPITGKVVIPGFSQDMRKLPPDELQLLKKACLPEKTLLEETGLQKLLSHDAYPPDLLTKVLPSLEINGMISGYTGEGSKTIIPYKASVKFSCRLVPYMDADTIENLIQTFVKKRMPDTVSYNLQTLGKNNPFYTKVDNPFMIKTADVFSSFFKKETVLDMSGGSIGAAEILQRLFRKPVIPTGFVLPDCRMHGPNENFDEDMFWKGIGALTRLYKKM